MKIFQTVFWDQFSQRPFIDLICDNSTGRVSVRGLPKPFDHEIEIANADIHGEYFEATNAAQTIKLAFTKYAISQYEAAKRAVKIELKMKGYTNYDITLVSMGILEKYLKIPDDSVLAFCFKVTVRYRTHTLTTITESYAVAPVSYNPRRIPEELNVSKIIKDKSKRALIKSQVAIDRMQGRKYDPVIFQILEEIPDEQKRRLLEKLGEGKNAGYRISIMKQEHLKRDGVILPDEVREITADHGVIRCRYRLAKGIEWRTKPKTQVVSVKQDIPQSIIQSSVGKSIRTIVEHPYLTDDMIVWEVHRVSTQTNFYIQPVYRSEPWDLGV